MSYFRNNLVPFTFALVVHAALVIFLVFNFDWSTERQIAQPQAAVIQAVVIDESKVRKEQEKLKKFEDRKHRDEEKRKKRVEDEVKAAENKRLEAENKRVEEEKRLLNVQKKRKEEEKKANEAKIEREQEIKKAKEERKKRKAEEKERKKREEIERKQEEEERTRKEEVERKRRKEKERQQQEDKRQREEAEEALRKQLDEEQLVLDAVANRRRKTLMSAYVEAIRQDVERSWRKPPSVKSGMSCVVSVNQIPGGEVVDAKIVKCNTSDANFRTSVVNAVFKASPLPKPGDSVLFQRKIEFIFDARN